MLQLQKISSMLVKGTVAYLGHGEKKTTLLIRPGEILIRPGRYAIPPGRITAYSARAD